MRSSPKLKCSKQFIIYVGSILSNASLKQEKNIKPGLLSLHIIIDNFEKQSNILAHLSPLYESFREL